MAPFVSPVLPLLHTHTPLLHLPVRGWLMSLGGTLRTRCLGVVRDNYLFFKASSGLHLLAFSIVSTATENWEVYPARLAICAKSLLGMQVIFQPQPDLHSFQATDSLLLATKKFCWRSLSKHTHRSCSSWGKAEYPKHMFQATKLQTPSTWRLLMVLMSSRSVCHAQPKTLPFKIALNACSYWKWHRVKATPRWRDLFGGPPSWWGGWGVNPTQIKPTSTHTHLFKALCITRWRCTVATRVGPRPTFLSNPTIVSIKVI